MRSGVTNFTIYLVSNLNAFSFKNKVIRLPGGKDNVTWATTALFHEFYAPNKVAYSSRKFVNKMALNFITLSFVSPFWIMALKDFLANYFLSSIIQESSGVTKGLRLINIACCFLVLNCSKPLELVVHIVNQVWDVGLLDS